MTSASLITTARGVTLICICTDNPPQNRPYTGITYLAQLRRRAAPTDLSDQLLDPACIFVHGRFGCIAAFRRPHVQLSQRA